MIKYNRKRPIENLFGNDIARVLDFFIFNKDFSYSTKEISELTKISYQNIQKILLTLLKKEIILTSKKGNKTFYLNNNSQLGKNLLDFVNSSLNREIETHIKNSPTLEIQR